MSSVLAFIITLSQAVILSISYMKEWHELFYLIAGHFSPVLVFFSLLEAAIEFSGEFSYWMWVGLVYCIVKYFTIARALLEHGPGFCSVSALGLEILYLAGSTYYIVYNSYL